MKLHISSSHPSHFSVKSILIVACLLLATFIPLQILSQPAEACTTSASCQAEINSLNQEIAEYQKETARLNGEAVTLSSTLAQLSNEKAVIQAQVDISQAKYNQLTQQITETEAQIKNNQDALGDILADLYVDDEISPIEMLASSNTISDFLDKQEYRSSIRNQLTSTITKVKDLKTELSKQQSEVETVLNEQKTQRDSLVAKESEQQTLLNQTQGEEANYQKMIGNNESKIAAVRAAQAMIDSRQSGGVYIETGLLGAYPWNNSNCPMWGYLSTGGSDGNGGDGHGYGCRQCASYVAWRVAKEIGIYYSWGNANNFPGNARSAGYAVDQTARAGSIGVMVSGSYGHVVWVESDPVGGEIVVSQYNANYGAGWGMYSKRQVPVGSYDYFIHIK